MHELERHRIILSAVQSRQVAAVGELAELTGASEATIRRDIVTLSGAKQLRRVRGGAEATSAPSPYGQIGSPSLVASEAQRRREKRAIARAAVQLCDDDEAIIINGGTTTFQMVHHLTTMHLQVMTNSFQIAEHLVKHSNCTVLVPAGAIYREQSLIISPFEADGIAHFGAAKMFMGCRAISALGIGEADPLIVQSEQRLMRQAAEIVIVADSSKFDARSSMIVAPLSRIGTIVTDDGIEDAAARMLEAEGIRLVVAHRASESEEDVASAA